MKKLFNWLSESREHKMDWFFLVLGISLLGCIGLVKIEGVYDTKWQMLEAWIGICLALFPLVCLPDNMERDLWLNRTKKRLRDDAHSSSICYDDRHKMRDSLHAHLDAYFDIVEIQTGKRIL